MMVKGLNFQDIFENMLKNEIWENKEALSTSFIPKEINYRQNIMEQIGVALLPILKGETPDNVLIYGKSGTGKTLTTQEAFRGIRELTKKRNIEHKVKTEIINCNRVNTTYRILANVCKTFDIRVPFTGWPTDKLYKKLVDTLNSEKTMLIIALDEIDRLKDSGILYDLTRINHDLEESRLGIVGISNNLRYVDNLDPRVRSSLSGDSILFPPYTVQQLEDILNQRAELAFKPDVLDEFTIPLCAAMSAKEHGDARKAIRLLRTAGELAQREQKDRVTETHVRYANEKKEKEILVDSILQSPFQHRLILTPFLVCETYTTGEHYEAYRKTCRERSEHPLTMRRVHQILTEHEVLGTVTRKKVSRGRYGKTTITQLAVSREMLEMAIKKGEEN